MVQFYFNGRYNFIENNIVVGDEPNFKKVEFGSTTIFQRRIKRLKVFEFISVYKENFEIYIYHWFFDREGNYKDMEDQKCTGTECKLGSIEIIDSSPCIYIKKGKKIFNGFGEEHIPVYTVFDTLSKEEIELDTSTQDLSFSRPKPLKL